VLPSAYVSGAVGAKSYLRPHMTLCLGKKGPGGEAHENLHEGEECVQLRLQGQDKRVFMLTIRRASIYKCRRTGPHITNSE
jgi:hypothetical protein